MNVADVGIVGAGLAGTVAAMMLARAGIPVVLFDVHQPYPEDFRCEKIDARKVRLLENTGTLETVRTSGTLYDELWIARLGRVVYKRHQNSEYGIAYADLINALRKRISPDVRFVRAKVAQISTSGESQTITLADGDAWSLRLAVLASGPNNNRLREQLNIRREVYSKCHTVCVGFDIAPQGRAQFGFPALTFHGGPDNRIAYISLFPMRGGMRANMFVYRDFRDSWFAELRASPERTLFSALPGLRRILGSFETGPIVVRPIDLYRVQGYRQPGVVLVGDSFATSCPAAGTGTTRALCDVERLCNCYIPQWLQTAGMGAEKISAFYDDPAKVKFDAFCAESASQIRSLTIDRGLRWRFRRVGGFGFRFGQGLLQALHS